MNCCGRTFLLSLLVLCCFYGTVLMRQNGWKMVKIVHFSSTVDSITLEWRPLDQYDGETTSVNKTNSFIVRYRPRSPYYLYVPPKLKVTPDWGGYTYQRASIKDSGIYNANRQWQAFKVELSSINRPYWTSTAENITDLEFPGTEYVIQVERIPFNDTRDQTWYPRPFQCPIFNISNRDVFHGDRYVLMAHTLGGGLQTGVSTFILGDEQVTNTISRLNGSVVQQPNHGIYVAHVYDVNNTTRRRNVTILWRPDYGSYVIHAYEVENAKPVIENATGDSLTGIYTAEISWKRHDFYLGWDKGNAQIFYAAPVVVSERDSALSLASSETEALCAWVADREEYQLTWRIRRNIEKHYPVHSYTIVVMEKEIQEYEGETTTVDQMRTFVVISGYKSSTVIRGIRPEELQTQYSFGLCVKTIDGTSTGIYKFFEEVPYDRDFSRRLRDWAAE